MKTIMKSLVLVVVLCATVNTAFAEITCWPGIKIYSPGAGDSWICWDGYSSDCQYCSEEVVVRG